MLSIIASWVAIVGFPLAVAQLYFNRQQEHWAFEQHFVDRYWAINDRLISRRSKGAEKRIFCERYARLCEDEFELMRLGRIRRSTWAIWHPAVRAGATDDLKTWIAGRPDEEFHYMRQCLADGEHGASKCPAVGGGRLRMMARNYGWRPA